MTDAVRMNERPEAALFVLPPATEPDRAQIQAFAAHLGLEPYDARVRLGSPLPRLIRVGPRDELAGVAEALERDGLPALCLPLPDVLGHGQGWHEALRVREVEVDGEAFVVRGRRHTREGEIVVEDTPHRLEPGAGGLLVRGRYEFHATGSVTVAVAGEVLTDRATTDQRVRFAQLYLPGHDWPFEFLEDELDYAFLGPEKALVASTNFAVFAGKLSAGPAATTCDALERHSGQVQDSVCMPGSASYQGYHGSASALVTGSDSEAGANNLSRLLRHLWEHRGRGSECVQRAAAALLDGQAQASAPAARPQPAARAPSGSTNVTPEQRLKAREYARELALRGQPPPTIKRRLLAEHGLAPHQADVLVEDALSVAQAENRGRGKLVLAIGAALLVLGLAGIGFATPPPSLKVGLYVLGGAGALVTLVGGLQVMTGQDLLKQVLDTE